MMKNQEEQAEFRATGLFLSGFQSIAEPTYIPLKPLTMLYGPNSAGKSAIVDAIGLFEDIANRRMSQAWDKVVRWQYRGLDEEGNWPKPGIGFACTRVGVEFTVPENWKEHLDPQVKEFKNDEQEQPHLEYLKALVGCVIHIDVGIREGAGGDLELRVAVDDCPSYELQLGRLDDGEWCHVDTSFRRDGEEGFDLNDSEPICGLLRLYYRHKFWKDNQFVKSLTDSAYWSDDPVRAFVRTNDAYVDLWDIGAVFGDSDSSELHGLTVNEEFTKALRLTRKKVMNRRAARWKRRQNLGDKVVTKNRKRCWDEWELYEFLEELGMLSNALLQIGAAALDRNHVGGSRQILAPSDMTFREQNTIFVDSDKHRSTAEYVNFAKCLARDEIRGRPYWRKGGWSHLGFGKDKTHRVVNSWLQTMLPSLRGHEVRVDAYLATPLIKLRKPFGGVDEVLLKLYMVDAQGRPHEFEDVGSGFSYLFPILVALWDSTWSIIEQPELHLHPAAQCDVADVFIAAKNMGHAALIESHSENLILRILRRVRETNEGRTKDKSLRVTPDDVAVLYFDPQSDGTTKVKQLRISRDGDFIDRWPTGFFEERARELFGE